MSIAFEQLRQLFGKSVDDPLVAKLRKACKDIDDYVPDKKTHYVSSISAGFSLLFQRPPRKKDEPLALHMVTLYAAGNDGYQQYKDPPGNLEFIKRKALRAKLGDPVSSPESFSDYWFRDGLKCLVRYAGDEPAATVTYVNIFLPPEENTPKKKQQKKG